MINRVGIVGKWLLSGSQDWTLRVVEAAKGFVVVDAKFRRIKVKSPAYVALHHMAENTWPADGKPHTAPRTAQAAATTSLPSFHTARTLWKLRSHRLLAFLSGTLLLLSFLLAFCLGTLLLL